MVFLLAVTSKSNGDHNSMKDELSLVEWLEQTESKREELYDFSKSKLPVGVSSSDDMDKTIQAVDDAGRLLADAECFLIQETAQAVLDVKGKYEHLSADERKYMVKDRIRNMKRIVDGIGITHATIKNRLFSILNANRSR